jgi:hypothetical protein
MSVFSQMKAGLSSLLGYDVSDLSETELAQAVDDAVTASETATPVVAETTETPVETTPVVDQSEVISTLEARIGTLEQSLSETNSVLKILTAKVAKSNVSVPQNAAKTSDASVTAIAEVNNAIVKTEEKTVKPLNMGEVVSGRFSK